MADGVRHAKATKTSLRYLLAFSAVTVFYDLQSIGIALGAILGHILTPDIDHHEWTHEEYRIYRYSKLLGWLWWFFWLPYEKFAAHRGISHRFILGTATRFIYLLWYPVWLTPQYRVFWIYVFVAWCIQDVQHLRLDRKKKKKKRYGKSRIRNYRRYRNY